MEATLELDDELWGRNYNVACYLALAGEHDAAFDRLRTALELDRDQVLKWLPHDTDLDPLRDDPRFAELTS
jgi:adenylate cyclase